MKHIVTIFLFLYGTSCSSQSTEFGKSNNGLIYADTTVKQLQFIVDSLNLKFKVCELNKTYVSKFQAKAHFISFDSGEIKEAKRDIESNISFDDFIKKYNLAKVEKELLIVKFKYKNYEEKEIVEFSNIELGNRFAHQFTFDTNLKSYDGPLKGKWIYQYEGKTNYTKESIDAFYFIEEFSQKPIPEMYARMIQYADCMVDTSTQVFYEKAYSREARYRKEEPSKSKAFLSYIHKSTHRPEYAIGYVGENNEEEYLAYWEKYQVWDSLRLLLVDSLRTKDEKFDALLKEAVNDAITQGGTDNEFEEYVGLYYSRETALELKRNRIVVGSCSQDRSPRVHALNIAKLSAETINWEIFLRSHLDIMNDMFARNSDGNYAWGQRKTYIKELEVLDINVLDLLLGISLRIENPSKNHYYGDIRRLGRALSETNQSTEIEAKMLQMIADNQLDELNRVLMYYLFINYNYNLDNVEKQTVNKEKLLAAIGTWPEYLMTKVTLE